MLWGSIPPIVQLFTFPKPFVESYRFDKEFLTLIVGSTPVLMGTPETSTFILRSKFSSPRTIHSPHMNERREIAAINVPLSWWLRGEG